MKMTMEPRTVSGTGFCSRNDEANRITPKTARVRPPTKSYRRWLSRRTRPCSDGIASDITPLPSLAALYAHPLL